MKSGPKMDIMRRWKQFDRSIYNDMLEKYVGDFDFK